ncbi:epoxide hydrolase N terminus-domain-containing protein, partial [Irpex lacteus]
MNQFPQFKVTIESVDVHFIHQRSERADAIPLILLHGWPAGDFGALVATYLGTNEYPSCKLLNICATPANPTICALLTLPFWLLPVTWRQWLYSKIYTEDERKGLSRVRDYLKTGLGYFIEQATQPMTIGYALHDSPIGLLAWIGEKYKELVDPEVLPAATNFILTTVSLYYLTGSFVTSTLPYHENTKTFSKTLRIVKPLGVSHFPYDCLNVPLGWIKSQHRNV